VAKIHSRDINPSKREPWLLAKILLPHCAPGKAGGTDPDKSHNQSVMKRGKEVDRKSNLNQIPVHSGSNNCSSQLESNVADGITAGKLLLGIYKVKTRPTEHRNT
jgi:hypothetical protein